MAVVRVRTAGKDKYGDPVEGEPSELTLAGAFVAPRTSADIEGRGRDGVVTGLTLFAPHGSDLVATDLVRVGSETFRIDGDIADWSSPLTGWKPGITADLEKAAG